NIRRSYSNLEMVDTIDQTEHRYSRGGALVQLKGRQHFTWSRRTGLTAFAVRVMASLALAWFHRERRRKTGPTSPAPRRQPQAAAHRLPGRRAAPVFRTRRRRSAPR